MSKCYTVSLSKGHFCITSVAAVLASDVMAGKKHRGKGKKSSSKSSEERSPVGKGE